MLRQRVVAWFDRDTVVEFTNVERIDAGQPIVPRTQAGVRVRVSVREEGADLELVATGNHADTRQTLIRWVPLEHGLDEIGAERLARVIHSASVALWEGREIDASETPASAASGVPPSSPSAPPPPPSAQSQTRSDPPSPVPPTHPRAPVVAEGQQIGSRWHIAPGIGYGATVQGEEGLGHGPCMRATVTTPVHGSELTLEAQFRPPHRFTVGPAEVELQTVTIRAGAGWAMVGAGPVVPYGWLGVGPDVVTYGTTHVDRGTALAPSPGDRSVRASAVLATGAAVALSPDLALRIEARADIPFYHARYQVETDGRFVTEASAWPIQPGLFLVVDASRINRDP